MSGGLFCQYNAYFGQATEIWKRHVIGVTIEAFDEYRDSVCQTLQTVAQASSRSVPDGSADGQAANNQEEMSRNVQTALENAQHLAQQRIADTLAQTFNALPRILLSPLSNQTIQANQPGESATSHGGVISDQNDDSLDVSIKSEVDSSSESECESDTDDEEVQVKDEPNEEENIMPDLNENYVDTDASSHEQTENTDNSGGHREISNGANMQNQSNEAMAIDEELAAEEANTQQDGPIIIVAGPSTLAQGRQGTRRVAKRQMVSGKASKRQRTGRDVVTVPLSIITKKLKCTVPGCKKIVKSKASMTRHLLLKHQLKEFRCLVRRCYGKVSTSFSTQSQLNDHRDLVHGSTTRWTCHCSKKFKSYKQLYTHYYQYHQLGHFACSKDGCTFKPASTRSKVQNHQRNHFEAKYECPVDGCDRSFKLKGNLDKHSLTHTGQRPFPCPECDKSFTQKSNLTTHLRIHRNDRCFRCTWRECAFSATDRSAVIQHIRTSHFKLPGSKKKQLAAGIVDDRDARDFVAKN